MVDAPAGEAIPRRGRGTEGTGDERPLTWEDAQQRLSRGGWFWLTTIRPDGAPHVRPLFAVWSDAAIYVASKDTARKSRNLAGEARCTLAHDAGDAHLVVEGVARRVDDEPTLRRVSDAYQSTYEWPTTPSGGKLDAEYGAPTSGGPPYDVYEITPTKVIAFPTYDGAGFEPTRWRF
jgi:hypothetical protein